MGTGPLFLHLACNIADQAGMSQLADFYGPMLAKLSILDPVPAKWLHLTMQGIGFTDEVDNADVAAIIKAAQVRCAVLKPFTATIGPPCVDTETIQMRVQPVEPLIAVRACIRDAIADVWGQDRVPEPTEGWRPHVSLAYSNGAGPAQPITEALAAYPPQAALVTISFVSVIQLNRDHKRYEWKDVATVKLVN